MTRVYANLSQACNAAISASLTACGCVFTEANAVQLHKDSQEDQVSNEAWSAQGLISQIRDAQGAELAFAELDKVCLPQVACKVYLGLLFELRFPRNTAQRCVQKKSLSTLRGHCVLGGTRHLSPVTSQASQQTFGTVQAPVTRDRICKQVVARSRLTGAVHTHSKHM